MSLQRSLPFLAILLLLLACGMAFADVGEPTAEFPTPAEAQPWGYQLGPIFQSASAKYHVPLPLLLALAYTGSAFENRGGAPTIESGYGVMALRKNAYGGTSLADAAKLISVSEEDLKLSGELNIMGAAAVLASYAKMLQVRPSDGLDAWLPVVIKYAALDPEFNPMFAMEIYKKLQTGLDVTNTAGESFSFPAQDIGSVDLAALEPAGMRVQSSDYAPAIWSAAATCNYTASYCAKDTVIFIPLRVRPRAQ